MPYTSFSRCRTYVDAHSTTDQSCLAETDWSFINHKVANASSKGFACGQAECQERFCKEVKKKLCITLGCSKGALKFYSICNITMLRDGFARKGDNCVICFKCYLFPYVPSLMLIRFLKSMAVRKTFNELKAIFELFGIVKHDIKNLN